jgi:hypothetical protein
MSSPEARDHAARRVGAGAGRLSRAWRGLPAERRLAAGAALGLFVTLFLPWYQDTVIAGSSTKAAELRAASASITGWGAFSFVEAAVLLVAAGVLVLLFVRAEGAAFHVPGGDGGVITAAGVWAGFLIVWRIFDKEGGHSNHGQYLTSTGIEWGIFIALAVAGLLTYTGSRIKLAHEPEPPLPGERPRAPRRARRRAPGRNAVDEKLRGFADEAAADWVTPRQGRPRRGGAGEAPTQHLSSDEAPTERVRADQAPTQQVRADQAPTQRVRADQAATDWAPSDEGPAQASAPDEAPTQPSAPDEAGTQASAPDETQTRPVPADRWPSRRPIEFPDLDEIDFEDPPTARLGGPDPDPDEHLTIPLDQRPD